MLVLTRYENQDIVIVVPGRKDPIVITLVRINGDKARLGFEADNDISIHRREVYEAIIREQKSDTKKMGS